MQKVARKLEESRPDEAAKSLVESQPRGDANGSREGVVEIDENKMRISMQIRRSTMRTDAGGGEISNRSAC